MSVEILPPRAPRHRAEPGTIYTPNSWAQLRAHQTTTLQALYSGRYGSSKSRTICEKGDYRCRAYPGARVVIARKKRAHMTDTTIHTLLDEVITPGERDWGWSVSASTLHYPNGSKIICVGLDNPGRLRSGEFDLALVDQAEELTEEEWNAIAGRLRHPHGPFSQLMGACNPSDPTHFLYRKFKPNDGSHIEFTAAPIELLDGTVIPRGYPLRETILAGARDNVENLRAEYQLTLQTYTGGYYDRYVLGKWVAFEGAVYGDWNPDDHRCLPPAEWAEWKGLPPPTWERVVGIDFGYENPFVAEWFAISPEGHWYRYRELYLSGVTVDVHAQRMAKLEADELATLRAVVEAMPEDRKKDWVEHVEHLNIRRYCDHDSGERALLRSNGISNRAANKEIEAGLQSVMRLLSPRALGGPHLHFVRGSQVEIDRRLGREGKPTCVEDEFPIYKWSTRASGELAGAGRDLPIDRDNHGLDAVRYAIHSHLSRSRVAVF